MRAPSTKKPETPEARAARHAATVLKARESAIEAETKAEGLVTRALDQLHTLNTELLELQEKIRAAQPVANGAVCLELYPCGRGCLGCPHPRWMRYYWTASDANPGVMIGTNLSAKNKDPVLALSRKEAHFAATAALIRRAKSILDERSTLLAAFSRLRHLTD